MKVGWLTHHKNASENIICEMAAILSRGGWVKMSFAAYFFQHISSIFPILIQILMMWSQQNVTHSMAMLLLWHMQAFVITL